MLSPCTWKVGFAAVWTGDPPKVKSREHVWNVKQSGIDQGHQAEVVKLLGLDGRDHAAGTQG